MIKANKNINKVYNALITMAKAQATMVSDSDHEIDKSEHAGFCRFLHQIDMCDTTQSLACLF